MYCGEPLTHFSPPSKTRSDDQFHPFFWNISKSPNYERSPSLLHIAPPRVYHLQVNFNHLRTPYNIFIKPLTNNISNLFHSLHQIAT